MWRAGALMCHRLCFLLGQTCLLTKAPLHSIFCFKV
jgi:hypothetical protein